MDCEARVKEFIRDSLGCGCDEEVFRHIMVERGVRVGGATLVRKINVGNRLLVYVLEAGADTIKQLPLLVKAGRGERDARGFNRFRLVLLSNDKNLKRAAFDAFNAIEPLDEKVHLHVLRKDEAKGI